MSFKPVLFVILSFSIILSLPVTAFSQYVPHTNDNSLCQFNSTNILLMPEDSVRKKIKHHHVTDPMTVTYESLLIPGWGQLSNRQYWKMPIIYLGLGLSIYSLDFAVKHYKDFRTAYIYRTDKDSTTIDKYDPRLNNGNPKYADAQLKIARDYYRRNAEISVIFIAGFYLLNVVDAYVSSQLLKFDVSDDLSINVIPPLITPFKEKQYFSTGFNITF